MEMVVGKVKNIFEKACVALIGAALSLLCPRHVYAHIFDERPGLGAGMTIILSAIWIAVVIGIVFLVRRLMRPQRRETRDRSEDDNRG